MIFYLENTWTMDGEADDIITYANNLNIPIKIMSASELHQVDSHQFISSIYFCNTSIVQYHLSRINKMHLVPDTYESIYSKYFCRQIEKISFVEFINKYCNNNIKRFVKPTSNDKNFDGCVISNINDFEEHGYSAPNLDQLVYSCEPIEILSEVRLLIGNNKLYGHGHINRNINDSYLTEHYSNGTKFIDELIDITGEKFRCIDIGFIYLASESISRWSIIEINPPFSLDDYQIPFDNYINFCIDSCRYICDA